MTQVHLQQNGGDVLLFSHRRMKRTMAFCLQYELEDVVAELTQADIVEPEDWNALNTARRAYRVLRKSTGSSHLAQKLAPKPPQITLDKDYKLFLPVFNNIHEVHGICTVSNWRQRCEKAACFINEVWLHEAMPDYLVEVLSEFDMVFLGLQQTAEHMSSLTGKPCEYLPLATDVIQFAPDAARSGDTFDVCNLGRRSEVTHGAFAQLARQGRIRYYFDSISTVTPAGSAMTYAVKNPADHRLLLSQILKSSRYFIANRSRIDQPEYPREREEISSRFYEGAAAATVMLGEAPRNSAFGEQFEWTDSVIHLPFDSPDAGDVIADLDRDPDRLARVRCENLFQAASRHDWLHRLLRVYQALGLEPTPAMARRKDALDSLAEKARTLEF